MADFLQLAISNPKYYMKDYSSGQSNEVAIYKDRVEIYNPGTFPEGFEPQDFIDRPERPIRRNPKIARILYYSKDIESFGTGLKRIADACDNAGVRYEFKKMKSGFVVCFYRSVDDETERSQKGAERKANILKVLKENSTITQKELAEKLELTRKQIQSDIKELQGEGLLVQEGSNRKGYWTVNG